MLNNYKNPWRLNAPVHSTSFHHRTHYCTYTPINIFLIHRQTFLRHISYSCTLSQLFIHVIRLIDLIFFVQPYQISLHSSIELKNVECGSEVDDFILCICQPAGSSSRCMDCPVESSCVYSAKRIYLDMAKSVSLCYSTRGHLHCHLINILIISDYITAIIYVSGSAWISLEDYL